MKARHHIHLAVDIMCINKIPFLVTFSGGIRFATVECLPNRQIPTIKAKLESVLRLYAHRGFTVAGIFADPEFETLRRYFPQLDTCGANDHVPDIERFIRTIKDRARSASRMLPFNRMPRVLVTHLIYNTVFWLNAFPAANGASTTISPQCIMTGSEIEYSKHVRLEFGKYVQTHEDHDNQMLDWTIGAICLGPTGNRSGAHYFLHLTTGMCITRSRWTALPMPREVITRVNTLGRQQNMPSTLAFGDHLAHEIHDQMDDFLLDDKDDSSYDTSKTSSDDDDFDEDNLDDDDAGDDDVDSDDPDGNDDTNDRPGPVASPDPFRPNAHVLPELPLSHNTGAKIDKNDCNEPDDD